MKSMLEQHRLQINENTRRIEQNEKISRSLNIRLFGCDFAKCKFTVTLDNGRSVDRVEKPYDLFIKLVVDGMNRTIEEAHSLALKSIHWTGRLNDKCILVSFLRSEDKMKFYLWKRKLDKQFKPHGRNTSIRNDLTKQQYEISQRARSVANLLRIKGFYVIASDLRVGVGVPPNRK